MLASRTKMSRSLFGRTSSVNLGFPKPSQQTMDHSLTVLPSKLFVQSSKSRTYIPCHGAPKATGKQRQRTKPCYPHQIKCQNKPRKDGWRSCSTFCGPTRRRLDDPQEILILLSHMGWTQSSPRRQACPCPGLPCRVRGTKTRNSTSTQIGQTK